MDTTGIGTRAPAASRFLVVAAVVFAVIHLIDFTFYGQSPAISQAPSGVR